MAKRRHNKAALIREIQAEKPDATANEIVAALAGRKVKVTTAYIYALRAKSGKPTAGALNGVDDLLKAKKMADALGGVDAAREMLAWVAKLV
jgi:hypothetical protein